MILITNFLLEQGGNWNFDKKLLKTLLESSDIFKKFYENSTYQTLYFEKKLDLITPGHLKGLQAKSDEI